MCFRESGRSACPPPALLLDTALRLFSARLARYSTRLNSPRLAVLFLSCFVALLASTLDPPPAFPPEKAVGVVPRSKHPGVAEGVAGHQRRPHAQAQLHEALPSAARKNSVFFVFQGQGCAAKAQGISADASTACRGKRAVAGWGGLLLASPLTADRSSLSSRRLKKKKGALSADWNSQTFPLAPSLFQSNSRRIWC